MVYLPIPVLAEESAVFCELAAAARLLGASAAIPAALQEKAKNSRLQSGLPNVNGSPTSTYLTK